MTEISDCLHLKLNSFFKNCKSKLIANSVARTFGSKNPSDEENSYLKGQYHKIFDFRFYLKAPDNSLGAI
jgi:hypothetical protein